MTNFSKLRCGCIRNVSILETPATKHLVAKRDPGYYVRKFLSVHIDQRPDLFDSTYHRVRGYFANVFGMQKVYHPNDVLLDLKNASSPGPRYKKMGFVSKSEVINTIPHLVLAEVSAIRRKDCTLLRLLPAHVFTAKSFFDQEANAYKDRVAWAFPFCVSVIEYTYAKGFIDSLPQDWVPKPETHHAKFCGQNSVGYDFTAFDSSIPSWLINDAFRVLKSLIDFSAYEGGGKPTKVNAETCFDAVVDYFIHTPFYVNGQMLRKHHGVPSGSVFTNLITTICSRLIWEYCHNMCLINTYGDDTCVAGCSCNQTTVVNTASIAFGVTAKVEESNRHGCLTFCKSECHLGQPFHTGLWFSNIFNRANPKYHRMIAECLQFIRPTRSQREELILIERMSDVATVPDRVKQKYNYIVGSGTIKDRLTLDRALPPCTDLFGSPG